MDRPRVAVVGSGVSGLVVAWLLSPRYRVTLFEAQDRLGGHTHTVDVEVDGIPAAVDTGFLVFNDRNYANFTALLDELGVASVPSSMSFSVAVESQGIEWAGTSLPSVFAQRSNLFRPGFWVMLGDILRFNRQAVALLSRGEIPARSLGAYLEDEGFGTAFRDWYLLPMAASIWSCPTAQMLHFPLATLLGFFHNHGLLQIRSRPRWSTVLGGARNYVRRLASGIGEIRLGCAVTALHCGPRGMVVEAGSQLEPYDHVVLACHTDQALRLIPAAHGQLRRPLEAIRYQSNRIVLHTDRSFLPRTRSAWASWNYRTGAGAPDERPVSLSYWLNSLQPLAFKRPLIETLNPFTEPAPGTVLGRFEYSHPVLDQAALGAQEELARARVPKLWFCGAWTGYGFHEDGVRSALRVANALGVRAPWQRALELAA